jgi:hypothetical protein
LPLLPPLNDRAVTLGDENVGTFEAVTPELIVRAGAVKPVSSTLRF